MRPLYIALEGIEGCGKSTQAVSLASWLAERTEMPVVLTRENGGTPVGQDIRSITHHRQITPLCEAMLFAADRAQHIAEVVRPALAAGKHVISDRSLWSTLAYQGYGRGLDVTKLLDANDFAIDSTYPNVVVHLRIDIATMRKRLRGRQLDRIEASGEEFFTNVLKGYKDMKTWAPCSKWIVVDATRRPMIVADEIAAHVEQFATDWWGLGAA